MLIDVHKRFGAVTAVDGISLTVAYTIKKDGRKMADDIWRCS